MNDLIASITQKVGITPDQAKASIEQVMHFLKEKLPAPLAGQLDGLLSGSGEANSGGLGSIMGKVTSMLGK